MLTRGTYSLVSSTAQESKSALLDDDALRAGIHFKAKLIGSMEVPRPTNRVEIVAAMRTVRYEFKEKSIKKIKIDITVSTSGVAVARRLNTKPWKRWKSVDDEGKLIMSHPVYRIFYVSHDSQDLQTFSYIACDSASLFKCHVFKASTKSGAIHIVRTIGRVFDVCHQLNQQPGKTDSTEALETVQKPAVTPLNEAPSTIAEMVPEVTERKSELDETVETVAKSAENKDVTLQQTGLSGSMERDMALSHVDEDQAVVITLRQQLRLEGLKCQQLKDELQLAQSQLRAEAAARLSLQAHVQQLMLQNQRLLKYISELVYGNKQFEFISSPMSDQLIDLHSSPEKSSSTILKPDTMFNLSSRGTKAESAYRCSDATNEMMSPDSGHREMSSDGGTSADAISLQSSTTRTASYSALLASSLNTPDKPTQADSTASSHGYTTAIRSPHFSSVRSEEGLSSFCLDPNFPSIVASSGNRSNCGASSEINIVQPSHATAAAAARKLDAIDEILSDSFLRDFDALCIGFKRKHEALDVTVPLLNDQCSN